jgi:hypothetical protein
MSDEVLASAAGVDEVVIELGDHEVTTRLVVASICCSSEASTIKRLLEPMPGELGGNHVDLLEAAEN